MSVNGAWVTLLTRPSYIPGALVVATSLRDVGSPYPFVVMVPVVDGKHVVEEQYLDILRKRGIRIRDIEYLVPGQDVREVAEHDVRFRDTWMKLRMFDMTEYDRIVYLDSDMIVLRNMDELMELDLPPDWIAASHACACNPRKLPHYPKDWIPENCAHSAVTHPDGLVNPVTFTPGVSPRAYGLLNGGQIVLNPGAAVSEAVLKFLHTDPRVRDYLFPDQDMLADAFAGRWRILPYCYNALKTLRVIHKPLWRDEEVRCLHYILHDKPWHGRKTIEEYRDYQEPTDWWWERFDKVVRERQETDPEGAKLVKQYVQE